MPRIVNPVVKRKLKEELYKGTNPVQAQLKAGLKPSYARQSTSNTCVKECLAEIRQELAASEVTVELVIKRIDECRALAKKKKDYSTVLQCDIALGKYLAMFTDKKEIKSENTITQADKDKFIDALARRGIDVKELIKETLN